MNQCAWQGWSSFPSWGQNLVPTPRQLRNPVGHTLVWTMRGKRENGGGQLQSCSEGWENHGQSESLPQALGRKLHHLWTPPIVFLINGQFWMRGRKLRRRGGEIFGTSKIWDKVEFKVHWAEFSPDDAKWDSLDACFRGLPPPRGEAAPRTTRPTRRAEGRQHGGLYGWLLPTWPPIFLLSHRVRCFLFAGSPSPVPPLAFWRPRLGG